MKKTKYHTQYLLVIPIFLLVVGFYQQTATAGYWDTIFNTQGMDGTVRALASSGGYIYAGGEFFNAGGVSVNRIARWNGSTWLDVGLGCVGTVHEITASGNDVYVGGDFLAVGLITAHHVAKWNEGWSILGNSVFDNGVNGTVYAIAVDGNDVYVGGQFSLAGDGLSVANIAKWDGNSWSAMNRGVEIPGVDTAVVYDILVHGGNVYVGGHFSVAGDIETPNVAYWDGTAWHDMDGGIGGTYPFDEHEWVMSLSASGSNIYAGTSYEYNSNVTMDPPIDALKTARVYEWNGSTWTLLGHAAEGADGYPMIYELEMNSGPLYAVGNFYEGPILAGEVNKWNYYPDLNANYIASWDGMNWTEFGTGLDDVVYGLTVSNNEIWVGGDFMTAGSNPSYKIARYLLDTEISDGLNQPVKTFQLYQNYPNPFNPSTFISYSVPKSSRIHLYIYNLRGEKIANFISDHNQSGSYEIEWDGKDANGKQVASGVYLYRLVADEFVQTKKMLFVR